MDTLAFLRRILPADGLYIIARLVNKKWRHQVCDTLEEAAQYALAFDAQGVPTYHACGAYRERFVEKEVNGEVWKQVRTQANVRALKAFWMDLDVDPSAPNKHSSQEEAVDCLLMFCDATGLPLPTVVSSGNGIHVYWILKESIGVDQWRQTAEALKALAASVEFRADPACTSDPARVLRPVGTFNRKNPAEPRPVEIIQDSDDLLYSGFFQRVMSALDRFGVKPPETFKLRETVDQKLNEQFAIQRDFPPCSAKKVADRCLQLALMRDTKGDIPEPHWYAGIQLMCHAVEGDQLIHEWSNGYAGYSADETNRKISQVRSQALGPTLCGTFENRNPGGCDACPFKGKITTPAQLGTIIQSAEAPKVKIQESPSAPVVEVALPNPPAPFTRRDPKEGGGIFMEEEGVQHKIYEYDCYPTDILFDENVGYEVIRLRHWLPNEGWQQHDIQSSLLARPTEFEAALRDVSVQPLLRNKMVLYMDSYLRKLRNDIKIRRLFKTMGWKDNNTKFVLGDRLYQKDGTLIHAGASDNVTSFLEGFTARGSLEAWREVTQIFDTPGCEPHAFMLLVGFSAPLLRLCNRDGYTVSAQNHDTGIGKSTMGKLLASIYGHWKATWIGKDSTANARVLRLGTYANIPAYMDEITTLPPEQIRELIYMMPTGKGRDALTSKRETREGAKWQTILICSTNESLQNKLEEVNANPEAESMRLFEFDFPKVQEFIDISGLIHEYVEQHYGVAGGEFIRRLVIEQDRIRMELNDYVVKLEDEFQMDKKERFWSQAAALALYAGKLAREWGIIDFDPERIRPWLLKETQRMRGDVASNAVTPSMLLGQYLNEHVGERLVVSKLNAAFSASYQRPRVLTMRYERDINTLWFPTEHFKIWLGKKHHNYNWVKSGLYRDGTLLNHRDKKVLGAGTDMTGGKQVLCWKIKIDPSTEQETA